MKSMLSFTLILLSLAAMGSTDYGGISFHSSITPIQKNLLKKDLRYLFSSAKVIDSQLSDLIGASQPNGQQLHHFLINRVRAIVGQSFNMEASLIQREGHIFPNTPLPDIASGSTTKLPMAEVTPERITMTNLGGGLYLGGKAHQALLGIQFDHKQLMATSPRVGILQVGEGLFQGEFLINAAATADANSISRIRTLFHESRHSDGTGISTGFMHALCPPEHAFAGRLACDLSHNGAYMLGALIERHFMLNCSTCSETEKTMLAANISDGFSRVLRVTTTTNVARLRAVLNTYINTRELYREMLTSVQGERRNDIELEITRLDERIVQGEARLQQMMSEESTAPQLTWDATPEGRFTTKTLQNSIQLMRASLRERP